MRRSKLTRSLHMALQIPIPLQANAANIDNIRAQCNGRAAGILAIRKLATQRLGEARQVLVQGAQVAQLACPGGLVDFGNGLGVEVADLK